MAEVLIDSLASLLDSPPPNPDATLNGAINASVTSLIINSPLPANITTGQFRIRIDAEWMTVSAIGGTGNRTWTVARGVAGSTAAAHANGASVYIVVLAESITQYVADTAYLSATSRSANTVLAAPNGAPGAATFRTLVAADIPATLAATTFPGITLSSTTSPFTLNASVGTAGQVLTSAGAGATPTWTTPAAALPPNGAAGGVLAGSYPNPTLATLAQNVLFTDNTYDIGATGATRPRSLYLGTNLALQSDASLIVLGASGDSFVSRYSTRGFRIGRLPSGSPAADNYFAIGEDARSGTDSNTVGGTGYIRSGDGTGNSTPSSIIIQTPSVAASGTAGQPFANRMTINESAVQVGSGMNLWTGAAALATSATAGFLGHPSCAGAPTGVPASIPTGQVPVVIDSTNNKLYAYIGGAWKGVTLT